MNYLNVAKAMDVAMSYGGIDGGHHKQWVIDQMIRALTNCPDGGTSDDYRRFVAEACDGEDGPNTYEWDIGIAP